MQRSHPGGSGIPYNTILQAPDHRWKLFWRDRKRRIFIVISSIAPRILGKGKNAATVTDSQLRFLGVLPCSLAHGYVLRQVGDVGPTQFRLGLLVSGASLTYLPSKLVGRSWDPTTRDVILASTPVPEAIMPWPN